MGITHTTASLLLRIRHATDRDIDPAWVDNTHALAQLNDEVRELWGLIAQHAPDRITVPSSAFTIGSGNTFQIGAGGADGVAATAFMGLRGVDYSIDGQAHWIEMKPWRFHGRYSAPGLRFRARGHTLEILPADHARTYPYRHWYLQNPTTLTNGGESVELPIGGSDYVVHGVIAKMLRPRFEEDAVPHFAAKASAKETVLRDLGLGDGGREPIRGANTDDDEDA